MGIFWGDGVMCQVHLPGHNPFKQHGNLLVIRWEQQDVKWLGIGDRDDEFNFEYIAVMCHLVLLCSKRNTATGP